jgi:hypothetical protein
VIHMDMKPANVLMTETGMPVLTDFDIALSPQDRVMATRTKTVVGVRGTVGYMAPEVDGRCEMTEPTAACDVYAFGVLFSEMYTLAGMPDVEGVRELADSLMSMDPAHRPTAAALLQDPFFTDAAMHLESSKVALADELHRMTVSARESEAHLRREHRRFQADASAHQALLEKKLAEQKREAVREYARAQAEHQSLKRELSSAASLTAAARAELERKTRAAAATEARLKRERNAIGRRPDVSFPGYWVVARGGSRRRRRGYEKYPTRHMLGVLESGGRHDVTDKWCHNRNCRPQKGFKTISVERIENPGETMFVLC